ncbi:MAG: serine hydrolase domain-containing protein, partial [Vitreimonas sp.]
MTEAGVPGLAIAVVHGDDPPIAQGFGVRRLGRAERVDADTVFDIASLTKSFTAAGAAALVDEGRLAWDDRVVRWLPHVAFSDPWLTEHVTLRDLLSHRTGLQAANTTMPPKRWPQREKPRLAKPPPRRRQRRRARRRSNLPHTRASTG